MASCMVTPTPTAGPLQAAMVGFRRSNRRSVNSPPPSRWPSRPGSTGPRFSALKVLAPPDRSAPAQKPRPAPVKTTARTSSSRSERSIASSSSDSILPVKALSLSGRLSVIVRMPSFTSYLICSYCKGVSSVLVDQHHAAHDERDAADLPDAERLVEQEVAEHGDDRVGQRDAREGDRHRDLTQREDVHEGCRAIEGEPYQGRWSKDLLHHGGRVGAGLEQHLSRDAGQDADAQDHVVDRHGWRSRGVDGT